MNYALTPAQPARSLVAPNSPHVPSATSQVAIQERMADVQMRYLMARQFRRDIVQVENTVRLACQRYALATMAQYRLPVGGSTVSGPSIRLAEVLAQAYGNLDIGREVISTGEDARGRWSDVQVFALDLESGLRYREVIRIHHVRYSKAKGDQPITDLSELERVFSQHAAKRLRECILRAIPRDLTEKALEWCSESIRRGEGSKPLLERIKAMVLEFERLGVKRERLEGYIGCAIDVWTPEHFEEMVGIYRAIRDGQASADEFFGEEKATGPVLRAKKVETAPTPEAAVVTKEAPAPTSEPVPPADDAPPFNTKSTDHVSMVTRVLNGLEVRGDDRARLNRGLLGFLTLRRFPATMPAIESVVREYLASQNYTPPADLPKEGEEA